MVSTKLFNLLTDMGFQMYWFDVREEKEYGCLFIPMDDMTFRDKKYSVCLDFEVCIDSDETLLSDIKRHYASDKSRKETLIAYDDGNGTHICEMNHADEMMTVVPESITKEMNRLFDKLVSVTPEYIASEPEEPYVTDSEYGYDDIVSELEKRHDNEGSC